MSKKNVGVQIALVTMLILGACLTFVDFGIEDIDMRTGAVVFGSLLFIGSGIGLLVALMRPSSTGVSKSHPSDWHLIRSKGKWSFVRSFIRTFIPWLLLGLAASAFLSYRKGGMLLAEGIRNHMILAFIVIVSLVLLGIRAWSHYERLYTLSNPGLNDDANRKGSVDTMD